MKKVPRNAGKTRPVAQPNAARPRAKRRATTVEVADIIELGRTIDMMSASERQLLDLLTARIVQQFDAMADRLDETNRRLDQLFKRIDKTKGKRLPSLWGSRKGLKRNRVTSARLLRAERNAR